MLLTSSFPGQFVILRKTLVCIKISKEHGRIIRRPTIYPNGSQPQNTVCFLMLVRHLVFTLFILKFLWTLEAHYKLYKSNREVYRNPAIPHLPKWNSNKPIGHRKNMVNLWGRSDLSNIIQQIKVKRNLSLSSIVTFILGI